jgi:hypothetical protein
VEQEYDELNMAIKCSKTSMMRKSATLSIPVVVAPHGNDFWWWMRNEFTLIK